MTTTVLPRRGNLPAQFVLRALAVPALMVPLVFLTAGRWDYWQGWLYLALTTIVMLVTVYVLRNDTALIAERLNPGQGMKRWDRWYFLITTPLYFVFLIVSALDGGRFGWSGELPPFVYGVAAAGYLVGQGVFLWAKLVNRFFSSVVRIQTERGHTVCRAGPYRFVRHPGYAASVLYGMASPLVLGSWWGLLPSLLSVLLLLVRTELEDRTLQKELTGYAEYTSEVKYRLLPLVW